MPDFNSINNGGYAPLLSEALPSVTSSTQLFANAPVGTRLILLTIRSAGITMTLGNAIATPVAATASSVGHDYAVNSTSAPYEIAISQANALKCRAIAISGTPTGYITYLGVP